MLLLFLISLLQGIYAQASYYPNPTGDPNVTSIFPSQPCVRYAITKGLVGYYPQCNYTTTTNWTCVCIFDYGPTLSSLAATYCLANYTETAKGDDAVSVFADFCMQLTEPSSTNTCTILP